MSELAVAARTVAATVSGLESPMNRAETFFRLAGYCYAQSQLNKAIRKREGNDLVTIWADNANSYWDGLPSNVKPEVDEMISGSPEAWGRLSAYFRCVANTNKPEFANAIECLLEDAEYFLEKV